MSFATLVRRVLLGAAFVLPLAHASAQNNTIIRCGTADLSQAERDAITERVQAILAVDPNFGTQRGIVTIPIAYHVITNGSAGNIPQSMLTDQTTVLNAAFASQGFQFFQASVDYTNNASWFTCTGGSCETAMKQALAISPATTLNFYTNGMGGGLLGWAVFPNSYPENHYMHGVVVHNQTLPGGTYAPFNLGHTGTHEVGHYVGLYHTFQGGCAGGDTPPGCTTGGDQVCDTNAEASPATGCPVGRNTCGTGGPDPIENFMDYSDDACYQLFTSGQSVRGNQQMALYRPTMYNPVPVELTRFDVNLDGTTAHLRWETASETNNAGFEVQVRTVGRGDFQVVGFVEGHGTTTEAQTYGYDVTDLGPGTHMFRLRQVDYDGAFEYSEEIEATIDVPGTFVLEPAYPNPFNPVTNVRFGVSQAQHVRAELVDVLGRVVRTLYEGTPEVNQMQTLYVDGADLTSGVYVVRVVGETFVEATSVTLLK
ncbi:MAG TPA: M43 family zinc metalloprotease [Rubricoccaceae bacterium]|nr:M43 family zinc metalloprotease [Rubricoccaceae bacterium]